MADDAYRAAEDALAELAFELGGGYRDDRLEDGLNNDNGQALAPLGASGKIKEKAEEGADNFVFPLARSIRDNPQAREGGWISERLIHSFPSSEAADFSGGGRRKGPFTMVYRAWREAWPREARVAVVASGRLAADSDLGRGGNEALVLGLAKWLANRGEEPEPITPMRKDRSLALSGPELRAVLWLGAAVLPLIWLFLGVAVWRLRRD